LPSQSTAQVTRLLSLCLPFQLLHLGLRDGDSKAAHVISLSDSKGDSNEKNINLLALTLAVSLAW
jgi:hypothetical protein